MRCNRKFYAHYHIASYFPCMVELTVSLSNRSNNNSNSEITCYYGAYFLSVTGGSYTRAENPGEKTEIFT